MENRDRPDGEDSSADKARNSEKGEEARKELDEIPPPGTDPLHEGP